MKRSSEADVWGEAEKVVCDGLADPDRGTGTDSDTDGELDPDADPDPDGELDPDADPDPDGEAGVLLGLVEADALVDPDALAEAEALAEDVGEVDGDDVAEADGTGVGVDVTGSNWQLSSVLPPVPEVAVMLAETVALAEVLPLAGADGEDEELALDGALGLGVAAAARRTPAHAVAGRSASTPRTKKLPASQLST